MVVDDSSLTIKKLTVLLEELGHSVIQICQNGEEAVNKYHKIKPDLVTMDITMPETNGIEATRKILKQHISAKIIMVTSHGQEQMVMDAIDAGALGYVLKPFSKEKLQQTIESVFK